MYGLMGPWRELRYIGIAKNPNRRLSAYKSGKGTNDAMTSWLQSLAQNDHRLVMLVIDSVKQSGNKAWARPVEQYWIASAKKAGFDMLNAKIRDHYEDSVKHEDVLYLRELVYTYGI